MDVEAPVEVLPTLEVDAPVLLVLLPVVAFTGPVDDVDAPVEALVLPTLELPVFA